MDLTPTCMLENKLDLMAIQHQHLFQQLDNHGEHQWHRILTGQMSLDRLFGTG